MIKRGYSKLNQFVKDCFKERKLSIKREIDKLAIELNTTYTNLRYQIYGWYPLTQELAVRLSKMIDVPEEKLFKLSYEPENSKCDKFPEWINRNLLRYSNCYIPKNIVNSFENVSELRKALEEESGMKIHIKRFKMKKDGDKMPLQTIYERGTYIYDYVAEVVR